MVSRPISAPLWIKLTGVIGAVIAIGVAVTVILARQGAATQFSHVMMDDQMVQPAVLQQRLVSYYQAQGSWAGLDKQLPQIVVGASTGSRMGA